MNTERIKIIQQKNPEVNLIHQVNLFNQIADPVFLKKESITILEQKVESLILAKHRELLKTSEKNMWESTEDLRYIKLKYRESIVQIENNLKSKENFFKNVFKIALTTSAIITVSSSLLNTGSLTVKTVGYLGLITLAGWSALAYIKFEDPNFKIQRSQVGELIEDEMDEIYYRYRKNIAYAAIKALYHENLNPRSHLKNLPKEILDIIVNIYVNSIISMPESKVEAFFDRIGKSLLDAEKNNQMNSYAKVLDAELLENFKIIADLHMA